MVYRTYHGFLTDEEFITILDNGKDLYFHADDLRERLPKYAAYRAELDEKQAAEYQLQMQKYFDAMENEE